MNTWKWTVLSDGWTEAHEAILLSGGSWRKIVRCFATAVLLENERHGAVLFDTGYSSRFFTETAQWPYRIYRFLAPATLSEPEGIAGILRRRGIAPESVPHVIVSHWHADHIGGLRDFPNAAIHASKEGWDAVKDLTGLAAVRKGFLPGLVPADLGERLRWLEDGGDLFGDGSIAAIALPGHAAGQIGIRFAGSDGRPVLLAADACWLSAAFRGNRMPHGVTALLHDWEAYRQTLARLHRLHLEEPELTIVPCHCPETAARIARP